MLDQPPAIIVPITDITTAFRLEDLEVRRRASARLTTISPDCPAAEDDDAIMVCGRRSSASEQRIQTAMPPPPMDDVAEPLVKKGALEFGLGRKGLGLRLRF
jgi:hypothetical protein